MAALVSGYNWLNKGNGVYLVLTPAHKEYQVDLNTETCSCPRFMYANSEPCKHIKYIKQELAPKPERAKCLRSNPCIRILVNGKPVEPATAFKVGMERELDFA